MKVFLLGLILGSAISTHVHVPSLSVADRCAILNNVVRSDMGVRWEEGSNMTKIIGESFPETYEREITVRDRYLIRPVWLIKGRSAAMFNDGESCNDDEFLLESEQTREEIGETEYIILVILRPTRRPNRFEFQERLTLYGPRGPGYFSVPPMRYLGIVDRGADGKWHASATKRDYSSYSMAR